MATKRGGDVDVANIKAGPQQPQKYPTAVGSNYLTYGEVPGYIYNPYTDSYHADKKAYEDYLYNSGQAERPKGPPSLADSVLPIALVGGTAAIAQGFGKNIAENGVVDTAKGLLGMGGEAAPTVANTATTTAPQALQGLQGLGATAAPTAAGDVAATTTAAEAAPGLFSGIAPMAGSIGGLGALGAIAGGTYLGGKSALNMLQGKEDNSLSGKGGRVVLGMATGGLSELARPFLMHKSTRDIAKDHTKGLLGIGEDDARYQSYVNGMRDQYNSAPTDPSKPFAGKYANFEAYKQGGLEAGDLTGTYGNIKAYGPEWAGLTFDQQKAVTQLNINDGLYGSKQGEVILTNEQKAKENLAKVIKPTQTTPSQPNLTVDAPPKQMWVMRDGKAVRR